MLTKLRIKLRQLYFKDTQFANLMTKRIFNVLLVANPYDAFMLEDDGRIDEKIFNEYMNLSLRYPPRFTQVSTAEETWEQLRNTMFDLVICMPGSDNSDTFDIAREIKRKIRSELNLVASAGVSYNKFLAKIASDYRKPDGLCTIHPDQALDFIARLPIESFWGVGPVTAKRMHLLGIHNGAQLRARSLEMLTREFGKVGAVYYDFARGIDLRPVEAVRVRKSIGCEHTLEKDINRTSSVIIELYHVAVELVERLQRKDFRGNTLTLKIKFHDFRQITRSITQGQELTELSVILPLAKQLLREVDYEEHPIRLIGLSVSNPRDAEAGRHGVWEQLSFEFSDWE